LTLGSQKLQISIFFELLDFDANLLTTMFNGQSTINVHANTVVI